MMQLTESLAHAVDRIEIKIPDSGLHRTTDPTSREEFPMARITYADIAAYNVVSRFFDARQIHHE